MTPSWCIMWTAVLVPVCSTPTIQPWAMHLQQQESPIVSLSCTQHLCDLLTCSDVCRKNYRTNRRREGVRGERRGDVGKCKKLTAAAEVFKWNCLWRWSMWKTERGRERASKRGDDNDQMSDWNLIHLMCWSSMLSCACSSHCGLEIWHICKWCETSTS